jgi:toxin ParE1/3/4
LAEEDLGEIWFYFAQEDPIRADNVIEKLIADIERAAEFPAMGRERPEYGAGIRSFPFGVYMVFYRRTESGISVSRILHASRDIDSIMG